MPRTRFKIGTMFACFLVALACAGCSCARSQDADVAEAPTQTQEAQPSGVVMLGFVGDICLADNYVPMQALAAKNSTDITDGIDERFIREMQGVDLMWVNNEFAYGVDVEPLEGKAWTFLASPANVSYLHDMGVDVAGLANNHVFDYGEEGFEQTLQTLEDAGIPYVGAGRTIQQAGAPLVMERNGVKVAYVAASAAEYTIYTPEAGEDTPGIMWCYDDGAFLEEIRQAAEQADYVVALPHWGVEHSFELDAKQQASAQAYIDAGADAVVGAHAHNLQGVEFYQGKPVLYNLGNFWFDEYDVDTVMAEFKVTMGEDGEPSATVKLLPGTQTGAFTTWSPNIEERYRIFLDI